MRFRGSEFVGGDWENGFGLQFDVSDDKSVQAEFAFSDNKGGPPGLVHGGALAAVMDEAVTVAAYAINRPGFTVNLNVDYRVPVALGVPVRLVGQVNKIEGRKTFLSATLSLSDGMVAVEAKALFISSKELAEH